MNIVYNAEAQEEVSEAVDHLIFDRQSISVVDELQADINSAEVDVLQFPHAAPPLKGGMRRKILRRFSYQLIYRVEGDTIRVYAFAHLSRKPDYWRKRVDTKAEKQKKS